MVSIECLFSSCKRCKKPNLIPGAPHVAQQSGQFCAGVPRIPRTSSPPDLINDSQVQEIQDTPLDIVENKEDAPERPLLSLADSPPQPPVPPLRSILDEKPDQCGGGEGRPEIPIRAPATPTTTALESTLPGSPVDISKSRSKSPTYWKPLGIDISCMHHLYIYICWVTCT